MAQIFYVHCPACGGRFPCHPELWQVDYDLLCPFCSTTFPQETSPLIITATGERRPGRDAARRPPEPDQQAGADRLGATPERARPEPIDADATAESM